MRQLFQNVLGSKVAVVVVVGAEVTTTMMMMIPHVNKYRQSLL
jgi:uncharacterized protein YhdP